MTALSHSTHGERRSQADGGGPWRRCGAHWRRAQRAAQRGRALAAGAASNVGAGAGLPEDAAGSSSPSGDFFLSQRRLLPPRRSSTASARPTPPSPSATDAVAGSNGGWPDLWVARLPTTDARQSKPDLAAGWLDPVAGRRIRRARPAALLQLAMAATVHGWARWARGWAQWAYL